MSETPEMYPLGRDEAESHRLNEQHKFLLDIVDGCIDREVSLDNISTVADVATGTGIWLWDAQKVLNQRSDNAGRYFHGFDISAAQFPPGPEDIEFSVQDVFKPFPAEHLNRYDLVHVRLLVTAFPEAEFQKAVANLATILKPGGYLQWVEIDFSAIEEGTAHDRRIALAASLWLKFVKLSHMSICAPDAIYQAYKKAGLQNVVNRSSMIRGRADLRDRAQNWQLQFFQSIMPVVLLKTGEVADPAQANERAAEIVVDLKRYFADGGVIDSRFGTVVGQKAS